MALRIQISVKKDILLKTGHDSTLLKAHNLYVTYSRTLILHHVFKDIQV